jgi:hypothetical protein
MLQGPDDPDVLELAKRLDPPTRENLDTVRTELESLDNDALVRVTLTALVRLRDLM